MTRQTADFLQPYKSALHIVRPVSPATMGTRRRRYHSSDGPVGPKRPILRQLHEEEVEQLPTTQLSDICTYWPPNPAFDPKRVLVRTMFFINEDNSLSVTTLYAIINPWWNIAPFGEAGPSPLFKHISQCKEGVAGETWLNEVYSNSKSKSESISTGLNEVALSKRNFSLLYMSNTI